MAEFSYSKDETKVVEELAEIRPKEEEDSAPTKTDDEIVPTEMANSHDEDENTNDGTKEQSPKTFPQKLFDILEDESHAEIISWCKHGNGFIIHKKKLFAAEVLPKFFKASKFTSFTRKLNRWGFNRIPRGPETGAYYHKLFMRGKPDLISQMNSNSGNKYQSTPFQQQQLLPNVPIGSPGMPFGPGMLPFMSPHMMRQMSPQQQQMMWHQHMHMMMQQQQMQMMMQQQMQGQQGRSMPSAEASPGIASSAKEDGQPSPMNSAGDVGTMGVSGDSHGAPDAPSSVVV